MKNIESIKKEYFNRLQEANGKEFSEMEIKVYSRISEFWAYVNSIVPDGFGDYSIFDFNGCVVNRRDSSMTNNISPKIANRAKDRICRYCWNKTWEEVFNQYKKDKKSISDYFKKNDKMMQRKLHGSHVAIYGQSNQPIGRTMVASIIIKEAMRLRINYEQTRGETYEWIDFNKLFGIIKADVMQEDDAPDISEYKACDWLVVDNIQKKARSEKQKILMSDMLDSFFDDRFDRKQPTILVFKFDIRDKHFDVAKEFGNGINKILSSDKTLQIPLSESLINI